MKTLIYKLLRRYEAWKMRRLMKKWADALEKLEKNASSWPPHGFPDDFGNATTAKPREGVQQNQELITTVDSMLKNMEYVEVEGSQVKTQLYRDGRKAALVIHDLETGRTDVK